MKSKHLSMKQLAQEIGVSQPLISMVLNDRWRENRISEQTRAKVLKKLEQLNFRPNRLATSLRNKRTDTIGLLVPLILGDFYQHILNGIESVLGEPFNLHLGVSEYSPDKESRLLVSFLERRVDGLIVVLDDVERAAPLLQEIRDKRIPLVLVDRYHRDLKTSFVGSNHDRIGRMAAEHLIQQGYQKLGFVSHYSEERLRKTVVQDRLNGFQAAAKAKGIPCECIEVDAPASQIDMEYIRCGEQIVQGMSRKNNESIGMFVMRPTVAAGVELACRKRGINIPSDVGLITVDGLPVNELLNVPMTIIHQQLHGIGETAGRIIRKMIDGEMPVDQIERVELDVKLAAHRSTQRV